MSVTKAPYRGIVQYAVSIPPFTDARTVLDLAVDAEEAGWDGVFLWDHLRWRGDGLEVHDPWALLAAIAVRTERVRLSTCVTPLSRRRPQVVAKQLTTLDHLSGGRAMLGVGLGEPPDADFADFGDEADARVRAERLDEALDVVAGLLTGERVDHDGDHFSIHAEVTPRPVQRPRPPIFVAGVAPHRRPLARALRWDGFFPIGANELLSPDELAAYVGDVDRPDGWQLFASLTDDDPAAFAELGVDWLIEGAWPDGDWVGDLRVRIRSGPPR